jgi:putative PIN family toxin of toxin-antitoxin system
VTVRAVLDANVFVSAAIQRGPSYRIVRAWLDGEAFELIVSEAVLAEVEDVLARPRLGKRIAHADARAFVHAIRVVADVVGAPATRPSYTRDPDDDYLIALARQHNADVIVSGDKDLLDWNEQQPPVVTPAAFERMLASG